MKRLFAAIGLVAIAACSTAPNSSIVPSSGPMAADTVRHFPISDLVVQSDATQNDIRPNKSAGIPIKSVGLIGTINGSAIQQYVSAKCTAVDKGGIATGCVVQAGKQTLKISKLTAYLFTKPKAKGCVVAISNKYSGTVKAHQPVPLKFKWTGKCS